MGMIGYHRVNGVYEQVTHSRYKTPPNNAGGEYETTCSQPKLYISETTLRGGFLFYIKGLIRSHRILSPLDREQMDIDLKPH